jgi:ankyrin repeat protein
MAVAIGKAPAVVQELVMMYGVNKKDSFHRTPLMFAALGNNRRASVSTLLRCSAGVDLQDVSGLTALHVACYHGNTSAINALLSKKASIGATDKLVSKRGTRELASNEVRF